MCVIPILPRSKKAAIEWKDYSELKKPKPTVDEIKSWFTNSDYNFAVICGKVSEAIEIDIDGEGGKKRFEHIFPEFNPNLRSAINNTMRVNSANGQKIIFKYRPEEWPEGINSIKDLWKGEGKHNGIELRGNGCYSLGVGSIHPDGPAYTLAHDSDFNPLTLTKAEIEELVDIIGGEKYNDHSSVSERLKNQYGAPGNGSFNDQITPLDPLSDEILNAVAANAKKYYVEGSKNDFTLGLCSTLRRLGVSYDDVYKLECLIDPADSKNLNRVKYVFNHNGPLAGKSYLTKVLAGQRLNHFQIVEALEELLGPVEELRKNKQHEQDKTPIIAAATVSEAQRIHFGRIAVSGRIISCSDLYQLVREARWKCSACGETINKKVVKITEPPLKPKQCPGYECTNVEFEELHQFVNAVTIKIQDDVPDAPLDSMSVIVFEDHTQDIQVGENIKIIGKVEKVQDKRSKKYHSELLAEEILYQRRRRVTLTDNDIAGFKRFVLKNPTDGLVKMFAPNVVGNGHNKLAILLSMIGAPENNNVRGRIHQLLIGPTGLAKTQMSREIVKVRPSSRYVSAKNSTGLSLTAIISKEQDNYVLNLGPVPLAKNELCIVNEFDKMHPEQQNNLLDVMEEGEIVVNKFAKLHTIDSPTTIIATANPKNNAWKNPGSIGLDDIPFESIILSRFDIVSIFKDITDEKEIRDFANSKTSYDEKHIDHNYNFLEKFIDYARTINPKLSAEAKSILNEFWVSLKKKNEYLVTNRTLESIHRIAKALARVHLSDIVDEKIACSTIKFIDTMFKEFYSCSHQIPEPKSLALDETVKVIQQQNSPIDLIGAVRIACDRNEQIKYYIGPSFNQNDNKKLREVCKKVLNNQNIQKVQSNPIVVRYTVARDLSDPSDQHFERVQTKNDELDSQPAEQDKQSRHNNTETDVNDQQRPAIETSVDENSRSQGSQGSRAVSIAKASQPIQALPTVEVSEPMTIQTSALPYPIVCSIPKIRYTDDGRHDGVFWRIYNELESKSENKTVSGQELKARLISSNKFYVGDAVLITERMVRTGQLCIIRFDTYQRIHT